MNNNEILLMLNYFCDEIKEIVKEETGQHIEVGANCKKTKFALMVSLMDNSTMETVKNGNGDLVEIGKIVKKIKRQFKHKDLDKMEQPIAFMAHVIIEGLKEEGQ